MEGMRSLSTIYLKCDCSSALFLYYWMASFITIITVGTFGNLSERNCRWRCCCCIGAMCISLLSV